MSCEKSSGRLADCPPNALIPGILQFLHFPETSPQPEPAMNFNPYHSRFQKQTEKIVL